MTYPLRIATPLRAKRKEIFTVYEASCEESPMKLDLRSSVKNSIDENSIDENSNADSEEFKLSDKLLGIRSPVSSLR